MYYKLDYDKSVTSGNEVAAASISFIKELIAV
jgi:hypothetical protein